MDTPRRVRRSLASILLLVVACTRAPEPVSPEQFARDYVQRVAAGLDVASYELTDAPPVLARWSETSVEIPKGRTVRSLVKKTAAFSGPGKSDELAAHGLPMAVPGAMSESAVYYIVWFVATYDDGSTGDIAVAMRPRPVGGWSVVRRRP